MKLLCPCSTLDFAFGYGCTPAWWQFFKGLYELGHDVIAVPYQGHAIASPWWRVYSNPCRLEGEAFSLAKRALGSKAPSTARGISGYASKSLIESWIRPRWQAHLADILAKEKNVDAVIVFTIPVNHFRGIADELRARFNTPFYYYDGDVPASLPQFGGFASGFNIYEGANLSEYDGVICNSEGGADDLRQLGARSVTTIHWGVDPDIYAPYPCEPDRDVFFYGFGVEYRTEWVKTMLTDPSLAMTDARFAFGGRGFDCERGNVAMAGDVPMNVFREAAGRSRINLNITRNAHASVYASSSMRPFELAAMGCCIVSNPCAGIETWFDIGRELLIVQSTEEAIETYRRLLADPAARIALGESARARVLDCHTHRHRAKQIVAAIA